MIFGSSQMTCGLTMGLLRVDDHRSCLNMLWLDSLPKLSEERNSSSIETRKFQPEKGHRHAN